MPLFGSKFSPKTPPRRSSSLLARVSAVGAGDTFREDLGPEIGQIRLRLGQTEASFDDGKWITTESKSEGSTSEEVVRLRQENQQLREEMNLVKLKVEILLDMLAETTAETHLQDKEIKELRASLKEYHRKS